MPMWTMKTVVLCLNKPSSFAGWIYRSTRWRTRIGLFLLDLVVCVFGWCYVFCAPLAIDWLLTLMLRRCWLGNRRGIWTGPCIFIRALRKFLRWRSNSVVCLRRPCSSADEDKVRWKCIRRRRSGGMEPVAVLCSQLSVLGQFQDGAEDIFLHC